MPIRPFNLPDDLQIMVEILPMMFQYPENENWNVQSDEMENLVDTVKGVKRIWPLIRLLQLVIPPLRDVLRGYIWEEDSSPVGLVNVIRSGSSDVWIIGNVGTLPEFRRRGIARKLVQAGINYIQERGGKTAWLEVVSGNLPAFTLYESMGFEHFSGSVELSFSNEQEIHPPTLNGDYRTEKLDRSSWRVRYDLERSITPEIVSKYNPVEEGRFKQPALLRFFTPLIQSAMGVSAGSAAISSNTNGAVVGRTQFSVRKRPGGVNNISARLDPAHGELAPFMIQYLLHNVIQMSPGRRISLGLPQWQEHLINAALVAGFEKRTEQDTMGMVI